MQIMQYLEASEIAILGQGCLMIVFCASVPGTYFTVPGTTKSILSVPVTLSVRTYVLQYYRRYSNVRTGKVR